MKDARLDASWADIAVAKGEDAAMGREEVDDTDMSAADFRWAAEHGTPVRVVRSKHEYEVALRACGPATAYSENVHLSLARTAPQPVENLPARSTS